MLVLVGIELIFLYVCMELCLGFVLKILLKHGNSLVTAEQCLYGIKDLSVPHRRSEQFGAAQGAGRRPTQDS